MKRPLVRLALAAAWSVGAMAEAGESPGGENAAPPPGFVRLFNGKNLAGWKEVQGKPGTFRVEDGELIGLREHDSSGARSAYWLSTANEYGDFALRLQYKLKPKGNSGVFIRAPHTGRTSLEGMEIQLLDDGATKGKPDVGKTGSIYRVVAPTAYASRPAGQWNDIEIRCDGDRIRVVLNGMAINDARMDQHKELKNRPRKGHIGLSAHTSEVRFRNIFLRTPSGAADSR